MKTESWDRDRGRVFRRGVRCFELDDLDGALTCFHALDQHADPADLTTNIYRSYYGLVLIKKGDAGGLTLCRQAAAYERLHADVLHNLARAEHQLGNRRQAYVAVSRGLRINMNHRGLKQLRQLMGARGRPVIPFLRRDNILNRWLGKLRYRITHHTPQLRAAG